MINFKINNKELYGKNLLLDLVFIMIYAIVICPLLILIVIISPVFVLLVRLKKAVLSDNKYNGN